MKNKNLFFQVLCILLVVAGCNITGGNKGLSIQEADNPNNDPQPIGPPPGLMQYPPKIGSLIATADKNKISLSWEDLSPYENGFEVWRDEIKVGSTDRNASAWTDTQVLPDTTYCYTIIAYNKEYKFISEKKCATIILVNHPPIITGVTTPVMMESGKKSSIPCQASDQDSDPLTYSWSATAGTFSGSGSTVQWTAPTIAGTYTIQCSVSDGRGGTAIGTTDITVVVLTPPKWTLPKGAQIRSLATDQSTGDVYAVGMTYGSLPGFTNAGGSDVFLAKFNPDGTLAWVKQWGTTDNDFVATNLSSNFVVFGGKVYVDWGTDPYLISVAGRSLSAFNIAGEALWERVFDSYIAGIVPIGTALYVNLGSLVYLCSTAIFKLDAETGLTIWFRDDPQWSLNFFPVSADEIYVYGATCGDKFTPFVGKYNPEANDLLWTSPVWGIPGPSIELYMSFSASSGGVYISGGWGENDIIPPDQGGGSDPMRGLLLRYDLSGDFSWAHQDDCAGFFHHIISDNDVVYALGCGAITKITNDGAVVWQTSVVGQSLALFNNIIFVANDSSSILRYDALTGK